MNLYVMRHAYAGEYQEGDLSNSDGQPLVQEGIDAAYRVARWMLIYGEVPKQIICSPVKRAKQTAAILAECFSDVPVTFDKRLRHDGPAIDVFRDVLADPGCKRVLILAHRDNIEPALAVLNGDDDGDENVAKIAMAELRALDIDRKSGCWSLRFCVKPSDLGGADRFVNVPQFNKQA